MCTEVEMPKYKCHKIVHGLKIKAIAFDVDLANAEGRETDGSATITPERDGYAPFKVDCNYVRKHQPKVGGYFVVYEGGYESWSPAEALENGYTEILTESQRQKKQAQATDHRLGAITTEACIEAVG